MFLPGESHGQRSLVHYSPWGHKELDMTERLTHKNKLGCKHGRRTGSSLRWETCSFNNTPLDRRFHDICFLRKSRGGGKAGPVRLSRDSWAPGWPFESTKASNSRLESPAGVGVSKTLDRKRYCTTTVCFFQGSTDVIASSPSGTAINQAMAWQGWMMSWMLRKGVTYTHELLGISLFQNGKKAITSYRKHLSDDYGKCN